VPLPVSVSVLAGSQRVLFDVGFHILDSMYLDGDFSPRFFSIICQVSRCNVIDRAILFRAFFTPGFLPAPMRLPPRCLVWFIVVKIARCSRAPVLIRISLSDIFRPDFLFGFHVEVSADFSDTMTGSIDDPECQDAAAVWECGDRLFDEIVAISVGHARILIGF
jgi:hypothetical protein